MPAVPVLNRIKIATISAPDVGKISELYQKWLGYETVEAGKIAAPLADSWGAPAMKGRPYVVMQPASKVPVYIRAVGIDAVPNYSPMTGWGWNAIEILVADPVHLNRELADSPFVIIGKPRPLNRFPNIVALQARGPAREILYFTCDTAPADKAFLPPAGATVGRPFVVVVGGPSAERIIDWYAEHFGIDKGGPIGSTAVDIIQQAQGLPDDHQFPLLFTGMKERAHFIEIDGYAPTTGPKPRRHAQLEPGVSMASLGVDTLEGLKTPFFTPPLAVEGIGYDGRRTATTVGAAGELVELIEG